MRSRNRALLIVEDAQDFSALFRYACHQALAELRQALPAFYGDRPEAAAAVQGEVLLAFDQAQARQIIRERPEIVFASVDLALAEGEEGLSDSDRAAGKEAGGIRVLQELGRLERDALAVVVTGETLLSYAREAFQKYKVLGFFQKARFEIRDYQQTALAALWYGEALHHLGRIERHEGDPDDLGVALACWRRAVGCRTYVADGQERALDLSFPEDLGLRIELAQSRLDAVTGRPGSEWTKAALKERVVAGTGWALLQTRLANLAPFRAVYPSQLDALHALVLHALRGALRQREVDDVFIGLIGREYRAEPCFVAILPAMPLPELEQIAADAVRRFQQEAPALLPYRDREHLDRLPRLLFGRWSSAVAEHRYDFSDLHAAIDRLSAEQ